MKLWEIVFLFQGVLISSKVFTDSSQFIFSLNIRNIFLWIEKDIAFLFRSTHASLGTPECFFSYIIPAVLLLSIIVSCLLRILEVLIILCVVWTFATMEKLLFRNISLANVCGLHHKGQELQIVPQSVKDCQTLLKHIIFQTTIFRPVKLKRL